MRCTALSSGIVGTISIELDDLFFGLSAYILLILSVCSVNDEREIAAGTMSGIIIV